MRFDRTGKVSLEGIYTQPDPRAYFTTLRELDYCIPQLAKPYFQQIIGQYRESRQVAVPTVVDVGCSYGVNAALLRCDATMDDLYDRYADTELTRQELLERDRELVRSHGSPARFVGLDVSRPALEYASAAGFLDDAVQADLETREPTARQRALFADADIVISTGCLGYVTGRTLVRVAGARRDRRPWMAHFVLRMFPFAPIADRLADLGYETTRVDRTFRQRLFASDREQRQVLETMSAAGVDPEGLETDGWLHAQLYVSRPVGTPDPLTFDVDESMTQKAAR
ncbi:class I SAM-dependent methyltransferase [Amorphoplanes digitatis]|uniref:Carnitine O-acetyltransferase n=1 Tax=Actinoplanes digitatis TaxID=1868 RepID=A0A7W7MS24_9ACTN|nr:class I SAM-dependent methyltransferase [Actinoplanes digitatis]MBB4764886.1 carnitine O-acetyltransferase [Actinoplanes digitatis]GID91158.1 methyltransferase type 12 [Actinoplanes digitatis]